MAQVRIGGETYEKFVPGTTDVGDDEKNDAKRFIEGGDSRVICRRIPTSTDGVFLPWGNVALSSNGTTGSAGDYFRMMVAEVTDSANAAVFLTQLSDPVFGQGTSGTAPSGTTSQTLVSGTTLPVAKNALAGRIVSIEYIPAVPAGNTVKAWFTGTIASNAQITTTSIPLVLRETFGAGGTITNWIIHGVRAMRLLPMSKPVDIYEVRRAYSSETGGFMGWGSSGVDAEFYGTFKGA